MNYLVIIIKILPIYTGYNEKIVKLIVPLKTQNQKNNPHHIP